MIDFTCSNRKMIRVLIIGIYLGDKKNHAGHLVRSFCKHGEFEVVQKWICIGKRPFFGALKKYTELTINQKTPKFTLLNRILSKIDLNDFDYLIVSDDDILVGKNFLQEFVSLQVKYDFALAQPARTEDSFIDHQFVKQDKSVIARRTNFVEIGPLFSIRRDVFHLLLPFDETSPMGWGLDFIWPVIAQKHSFKIGIIDKTPVAHSLRKPVENYSYSEAETAMELLLNKYPHLTREEAFQVLEIYH